MTIINGANHHTVEDLLSSIRSSASEDSIPMRQGTSSSVAATARREGATGDENAEFELPAIFKPGHHQANSRPTNLFGRLSDALKPTPAAEPERARTVIRFEPAAQGRMIEPPQPAPAQNTPESEPALDPIARVTKENAPVRREMPSFFDTRLNRLGEMTRQASAPKRPDLPKPETQATAPQPPPLNHALPVPTGNLAQHGLEDAAAQLLRPILKQWLTENMPKIVEKALRSEAGEDLLPKGQPPIGRKPG